MKIFKFIKDLLAPKKCYSCKKEGHFLCKQCYEKLENFKEICYVCKKNSNKFEVHEKCQENIFYDNLIILSHYKNSIIKKLIIDYKFYGKKDINEDFVELLIYKLLKTNLKIINNPNVIITSIPMNYIKKLKRGYNQTELLAINISKKLALNYNNNLIKKIKNTRQQSKLEKEKRLVNLKNCFKIRKKYIDKLDNKIIIVIDDVVSTGTTINEISKILKENNAKKIIGLCIASD